MSIPPNNIGRVIRITITCREKTNNNNKYGSENIAVETESWLNGEVLTVRINEITGLLDRARMQIIGGSFMQGALDTAGRKLVVDNEFAEKIISTGNYMFKQVETLQESERELIKALKMIRFGSLRDKKPWWKWRLRIERRSQ